MKQQKAYSFYSPQGAELNKIYVYDLIAFNGPKMVVSIVGALTGEPEQIIATDGLVYFSTRSACVEARRESIAASYAAHEKRLKRYKEIGIIFETAFPRVRVHDGNCDDDDDNSPPLLTG